MNWYKKAQDSSDIKQDTIVWKCPVTGISIKAHRFDGNIEGYCLHAVDNSFVDDFSTWNEANRAARELDRRVQIPKLGKLIK